MEGIQDLKTCPWISENVLEPKDYFSQYHELLDKLNSGIPHNSKASEKTCLLAGFSMPDDVEPSQVEPPTKRTRLSSLDTKFALNDDNLVQLDPFSLKRMESRTLVSKLTVDGELKPQATAPSQDLGNLCRVTNWCAGSYMDGIIPKDAPNLSTLSCQAKELYKRETVKDYVRLRNRLLKYSTTVRTFVRDGEVDSNNGSITTAPSTTREVLFNIRIHSPYHKRTYHRKGWNRFPTYSEEYIVMGSQPLTALRDVITCINDQYCHVDLSENPDIEYMKTYPTMQDLYPSGFFYFNGTFYTDNRPLFSKDISENVRKWIKKQKNFNKVDVADMSSTRFMDLKFRIGYPYLYQHLGNCEHLIIITDVRLHHRRDIQNPSQYPLLRGNPIKLAVKCRMCNLFLARWVVSDNVTLPFPNCHFCDKCLKLLLYDDDNKKIGDFKLYPFVDECLVRQLKAERGTRPVLEGVEVKIGEPFLEEANE